MAVDKPGQECHTSCLDHIDVRRDGNCGPRPYCIDASIVVNQNRRVLYGWRSRSVYQGWSGYELHELPPPLLITEIQKPGLSFLKPYFSLGITRLHLRADS